MSKTAEILCVGTEILLGNITNTNATFLSQELSLLGFNVFHHTVVGDNPERLAQAVDTALLALRPADYHGGPRAHLRRFDQADRRPRAGT